MPDTPTDVLVAAYPDIDAASQDFDALAELVKNKKVQIEGAILITHAEDGTVNVQQTADQRGRKGVERGGGVGFLVGLAAPPLLAAGPSSIFTPHTGRACSPETGDDRQPFIAYTSAGYRAR